MPTLRDRFAAARAGWVSGRSARSARVPTVAPQWSASSLRPRGTRVVTAAPPPAPPPAPAQSRAQTMFQAVTALTAVAALLFTARSLDYTGDATRATRDQLDLAAQGQIAERFSQAIDQLGQTGAEKLSIRLGGIYSLERIMRDSPDDEPTVIEVLCAFVRTNARRPAMSVPPQDLPAAPEDVRAAITVLGRRPNPEQEGNTRLDFTGTQLSLHRISLPRGHLEHVALADANLRGANLQEARLYWTDLSRVDLSAANLVFADLASANLGQATLFGTTLLGAKLIDANLRNADLSGTRLLFADLRDADLTGADLTGAHLDGAYLYNTDLSGADLSTARFVTSELLRCSQVDDATRLPPDVVRPPDVPVWERPSC